MPALQDVERAEFPAAKLTARDPENREGEGDGLRDEICDCGDAFYLNSPDLVNGICTQRSRDPNWIESWTVDDFNFGPGTITEAHWFTVDDDSFAFIGVFDAILLAAGGGPGAVLYEQKYTCSRTPTGEQVFGRTMYCYSSECLNFAVQTAGSSYFIGLRPVDDPAGQNFGQSFWLTAPVTGSEFFFKSEIFGYPDWTPSTGVLEYASDVAFCLIGVDQVRLGGACALQDCACQILVAEECLGRGGTYFGDGSQCCMFDCNENDIHDSIDIASGQSQDCDNNCVPDECLCYDDQIEVGTRDDFSGTEPATPGAELDQILTCGGRRMDFDDLQNNQCFGHTIQGLPQLITAATLEIRLKALSGDAFNDSLNLQIEGDLNRLACAPLRIAWGRRIGTSGGVPGLLSTAWVSGSDHVFVLDLAALPNADGSTTSILQLLHDTRRLDIYVQDDTAVDYVGLSLTVCPDCNQNGVMDSCDIAAGTSQDCDGNGIPDECEVCLPQGPWPLWSDTSERGDPCVYKRNVYLERFHVRKVRDFLFKGEHLPSSVVRIPETSGKPWYDYVELWVRENYVHGSDDVRRAKVNCDGSVDDCNDSDDDCRWASTGMLLYSDESLDEDWPSGGLLETDVLTWDLDLRKAKFLKYAKERAATLRACLSSTTSNSADCFTWWRDGAQGLQNIHENIETYIDDEARKAGKDGLELIEPQRRRVWQHIANSTDPSNCPEPHQDDDKCMLNTPVYSGSVTEACWNREMDFLKGWLGRESKGRVEYRVEVVKSSCGSGKQFLLQGAPIGDPTELGEFTYLQLNGSEIHFDLLTTGGELKDPSSLSGVRRFYVFFQSDTREIGPEEFPYCKASCYVEITQTVSNGVVVTDDAVYCWGCKCPDDPTRGWVLQSVRPRNLSVGFQRIQFDLALSELDSPCKFRAWAAVQQDSAWVSLLPEDACERIDNITIAADTECPRVNSWDASELQTGVRQSPIVVIFSEPMSPILASDIGLVPATAIQTSLDASQRVLTIAPIGTFPAGELNVELKSSIRDVSGNPIDGSNGRTSGCGTPVRFNLCIWDDEFSTCDQSGNTQHEFGPSQTVWVQGADFAPLTSGALYLVVPYSFERSGSPLIDQSDDGIEVVTFVSDLLPPTSVGRAVRAGIYTVIADLNQNGVFDEGDREIDGCLSQVRVGNPCVEVPADITFWLPMDERSGAWSMERVYANHGRHVGNPLPTPQPGVVHGALCFDGRQFVEVEHDETLDFDSTIGFSAELWCRVDDGDHAPLLSKNFGGRGWTFELLNLASTPTARFLLDDGNASFVADATIPFQFGVWMHVGITSTPTDGGGVVIQLFANGQPAGNPQTLLLQGTCDNVGSLWIARTALGRLMGCLDEVELYERTLALSEMAFIHRQGPRGKCLDYLDQCELEQERNAVLYVNHVAPVDGANDGSSWKDAMTDLARALRLAACDDSIKEIWVARGEYRPDILTGDRMASLALHSGLAVYGGFAGTETERQQRDPVGNVTTLTGDLAGNDGEDFGNHGENSYHVVTAGDGVDATAILDGFTITHGNADGDSDGETFFFDAGGGMHVGPGTATPTVRNCRFERNRGRFSGGISFFRGGGLFEDCTFAVNEAFENEGGGVGCNRSNPLFRNCRFVGNSAAQLGGGLRNTSATPTLIGCLFENNRTGQSGGGVSNVRSDVTYLNCVFSDNHAANNGAAVSNQVSGNVTFINTLMAGNAAGGIGGAIRNDGPTLAVTNCTIIDNRAASGGGLALRAGNADVSNTIVYYNEDAGGADESAQIDKGTGSLALDYSDVQGLTGGFGGTGNISADPGLVVNGDWNDNGTPGDPSDDFYVPGNARLGSSSPCIDAADNAALPMDTFDLDGDSNATEPLPLDLGGGLRQIDDPSTLDSGNGTPPIVDMGAYEAAAEPSQRGDLNCDGSIDFNDIDSFVLALISREDYESQYPDCNYLNGDINGSGSVDFDDIDPFVDCLINGGCP